MTARPVLHGVLYFRVFEKYGGTSPVTFATWFLYFNHYVHSCMGMVTDILFAWVGIIPVRTI